MAAKPPKPPSPFLKQSNQNSNLDHIIGNNPSHNNNSGVISTSSRNSNTPTTPTAVTSAVSDYLEYNNNTGGESNVVGEGAAAVVAPRPSCNCTNISIMHLFHEMKQEFPTIPDQIVAQCVNENCHQRDNCIQMLRNELALNPIPVQTYPAKVLQQHHYQQQQQQQRQQHPQPPARLKTSSVKPVTPLKPIRAAPTQPPSAAALQYATSLGKSQNYDSVEIVNNNNYCSNPFNKITKYNSNVSDSRGELKDLVNCSNLDESDLSPTTAIITTHDMPAPLPQNCTVSNFVGDSSKSSPLSLSLAPTLSARPPRARPNTLNLQTPQQQQQLQFQRQQLNIQLQQRFQQRAANQPQGAAPNPDQLLQRPIRKAPLPPIAPKPVFGLPSNITNNSSNNNNSGQNCSSPQSQSSSYSNESNVTSPLSSCGESEISVNVSLSSPTGAPASALNHINKRKNTTTDNNNISFISEGNGSGDGLSQQPQLLQKPPSPSLKSPIRHRSVITVQPEPPYSRDFLPSPKTTIATQLSGGGNCGSAATTPTGQKSFTSVNLTLRQPNSAIPQSTIDISAGPALCGNGSGLTYSSTSYDARRGYQKNFHITVTDKGGVFNASRIRPQGGGYSATANSDDKQNGSGDPVTAVELVTSDTQSAVVDPTDRPLSSASNAQPSSPNCDLHMVTQNNPFNDMCLPKESDEFLETIKRQKTRRDKLATALRENKKKLGHVEEEINMLTEPVQPGVSERLDSEIERLRNDCQLMLNENENIRRYGPNHFCEAERQRQIQLHQTQQQPFPHQQRSAHTSTSSTAQSPLQQPDLDFVQHHSATMNSPHQHRTPSLQHTECLDDDTSDSATEDSIDEEMWACVMCTFRNHPQLNICECCENCRILPDTPMLSRENIHITLSPGENRIVHSWVVS